MRAGRERLRVALGRASRILAAAAIALAGAAPLGAVQASGAYEEHPVADAATLAGRVTFAGARPAPAELLITRDFEVCGVGIRERLEVDVGEAGGLRDVVVFLEGVEGGKPWPAAPADGFALDQRDCYFAPYIQIVPRGVELRIVNSDPVLHNVHGYEVYDDGRRRTLFNLAQPEQGVVTRPMRTMRSRRIGLECDAHDFMLGWIFAAETPYAVLVDGDGGFAIDEVPPGTYTLGAWHPFLGVRRQEINVGAGATVEVAVGFE